MILGYGGLGDYLLIRTCIFRGGYNFFTAIFRDGVARSAMPFWFGGNSGACVICRPNTWLNSAQYSPGGRDPSVGDYSAWFPRGANPVVQEGTPSCSDERIINKAQMANLDKLPIVNNAG